MDSRTTRKLALCSLIATGSACAPQASDEYLGEPLLRMRGNVSTAGLTMTQPIVPALCFHSEFGGDPVNLSALPEEATTPFDGTGILAGGPVLYVLDVEVEGEFPAEFKVDVYSPPPPAAVAPLFEGEPPAAFGSVCAVQREHEAIAQFMLGGASSICGAPDTPCVTTKTITKQDGSRYYYERTECPDPDAPPSTCQMTRGGDVTLLMETAGFEHVVAEVWNPEVVYLAEPAPAGSYTAYRLGAPEGLPAGYHLRSVDETQPEDIEAHAQLVVDLLDRAVAETNATHGTDYDSLPDYLDEATGSFQLAPPDVLDTFYRTHAHLEMEAIPAPTRAPVSPDGALTLELAEKPEWSQLFP